MDDEVLPGMNKGHEEMAHEIRLAAVVKWYEPGTISFWKESSGSWFQI